MKRKTTFIFVCFLMSLNLVRLHAQTQIPYLPLSEDFGGRGITDLENFVPSVSDYTLEVTGIAGIPIKVAFNNISYTPESSGKVRFVQKDEKVYVYESNVFKAAFTPDFQYTEKNTNLFLNPGFEIVRELLESGKWKAQDWDALKEDKTQAWGAGSSTSVRENATYCSEGVKSLIMHGNAHSLTQKMQSNILKANTYYRLTYDYWTSSGNGNGGATYQLFLGTESCGNDLFESPAHTTAISGTDKCTFEVSFSTPENMPEVVWITLYRGLSRVDWLDNLNLREITIHAKGITGVTSAIYLAGKAYAPGKAKPGAGNCFEMSGFIQDPSFEINGLASWSNKGMWTQNNNSTTGQGWNKDGNIYVEQWVNAGSNLQDANISQSLTGLPLGKYRILANGHMIKQSSVQSATGACLFAGIDQTKVTEGGEYFVETVVVDGSLDIGFRIVDATGNWAAVDHFRLYYYGEEREAYLAHLPKKIALAETLYTTENPKEGSYPASLRDKLGTTLVAAKALSDEVYPATEEVVDMLCSLKNDRINLRNVLSAYQPLEDAIEKFRELVERSSFADKSIFENVITEAQSVIGNPENQTNHIDAAVTALDQAIKDYFWAYQALKTTVTNAQRLYGDSDYPNREIFGAAVDAAEAALANPQVETLRTVIQTLKEAQNVYLAGRNPDDWWVTIKNGALWKDNRGRTVQAHGAGFLLVGDTWYMIGEDRETSKWNPDISMYSSKNLIDWKFEKKVVANGAHSFTYPDGSVGKLGSNRMIERPKLLYCENTGQYVIWCHWESGNYGASEAAVFYSDHITGPYKIHWAGRPLDVKSRDCNVFQDSDGKAYFVSTTNENQDLGVFELSDDYLDAVKHTRILSGQRREAPALVRIGDRYHMLSSACSGWDPNQCQYHHSTSMTSGWSGATNLNNKISYDTQAASILTIGPTYLYVGDRWQDPDLAESKTILFPIQFGSTSCTFNYSQQFDINLVTGELRATDTSGERVPRNNWKVIDYSSQQSGNEASKAIDGNSGSIWHTRWSSPAGVAPHHITVDMGAESQISGFLAIPRLDNDVNGLIRQFVLLVSSDNKAWKAVAGGAWMPYAGEIYFRPVTARYFKLVVLAGEFTSLSEMFMLKNTPVYVQTSISPYYQVNGGSWNSSVKVNINSGNSVKFGPNASGAGSWAMAGPNGFASAGREVSVASITKEQAGVYTSFYLNPYSQVSTVEYAVTVDGIASSNPFALRDSEEVTVYRAGNTLFINSPQQEVIRIYSITGQLIVEKEKQTGLEATLFPSSFGTMFIIKGSSGWAKKIIL